MIAQGRYLTTVCVVPIHGISIDQMKTLRPLLLAESSIGSVERTKKTKEFGKWNVLVPKLHFKTAQAAIRDILEQFEASTPTLQAKLPPGWTRWSEKLIKHETDSVGEQSFLTMSAHSFASMITDADREQESTANGVEFEMSVVINQNNQKTAPSQNENNNNEVSHKILLLRAQLKNRKN